MNTRLYIDNHTNRPSSVSLHIIKSPGEVNKTRGHQKWEDIPLKRPRNYNYSLQLWPTTKILHRL